MSDKLRQALAELVRLNDVWRVKTCPIDESEWRDAWRAADAALAEPAPCIGADPLCPCQDGDSCHYKDAADGTKGWPVPAAPSEAFAWAAYDLSTLPKRAKPAPTLTDEQIIEAYCQIADGTEWAIGGLKDAIPFARAIERAVRGTT